MRNVPRSMVLATLTAAALAGGSTLSTAAPAEDYFIVDTQFTAAPSTIVEAGGAFATCTSVRDLAVTAEPTPNGGFTFSGTKRISCSQGSWVQIDYVATTTAGGRRTSGEWWVTASTLAGATSGSGTVRGDSTKCTPAPGSGGCILDTFSGDVA